MHRIGKIAHATRMIEMKVRVDDIANVTSSKSQLLKLSVHYVLTRKGLRTKRGAQTRSPVFIPSLRVRDYLINAGVP